MGFPTALLLVFTAALCPERQTRGGTPDEARQAQEPSPPARAVAVSPDGGTVAVAFRGGRVALLAAADGTEIGELAPDLGESPWQLAFSPDGAWLAGLGHLGGLRLWDLEHARKGEGDSSNERLAGISEVEDPWFWPFGARLLWSPSGDRLAVVSWYGPVSLWTRAGELVTRWNGERRLTDDSVAWSRDGKLLFVAAGKTVELRDGKTGEPLPDDAPLREIRCEDAVVTLAVHPTRNLLATGHADSVLLVWDLDMGKEVGRTQHRDPFLQDEDDEVASIAWSPSGDRLALSVREGSFIVVLDAGTLEKIWESDFLGAHFSEAMRVRWSPDGARLWFAFECGGGTLRWVDPGKGIRVDKRESSSLPEFGGDVGAILTAGEVHLVSTAGELLWIPPWMRAILFGSLWSR